MKQRLNFAPKLTQFYDVLLVHVSICESGFHLVRIFSHARMLLIK